jgi:Family of unknown function (DUF5752)
MMTPRDESFRFFTERRLVELTGKWASDLPELLAILREVSGSSIFYHTHHEFLSHHFEKPVVYNDFAVWVSEALLEDALGEKLAAIDLLAFTSVRQLREAIIELLESHLQLSGRQSRQCPIGDEFHFCKSKSFIMPTGITVWEIPDFFAKIHTITNNSLYFHFLEARLRLGRPTNDFSQWLAWRGLPQLAHEIDQLDPYSRTLDELKDDLVQLGVRHGVS